MNRQTGTRATPPAPDARQRSVTVLPQRRIQGPPPWERPTPGRYPRRRDPYRLERRERRRIVRRQRRMDAALAAQGVGPRRGERRAHAGRVLLPMRLPAHRATTANLQAIYPFVVETGLGSDGVYIGREAGSGASFVYDPWHLYAQQVVTNANILLAGVLGRGKSALAKTLAYRFAAFGVRAYIPGDPKGEWSVLARALGTVPLELGRGMPARINPLDPGPPPHRPG